MGGIIGYHKQPSYRLCHGPAIISYKAEGGTGDNGTNRGDGETMGVRHDSFQYAPVYSQASVTGCAASTTTTHTTTTTPTSSVFTPVTPTFGRGRRRSSSEGVVQERSRTGPDVEELSRVKLLVAARTQKISQDLVALLSQAQSATGTATQWIEEELRQAQDQLDRLENLESTTWVKIAMIRGRSAQKIRIQQWKEWQGRQMERVRQVTGSRTGNSPARRRPVEVIINARDPTATSRR